ncbi:phenylalanine--tRNA ligase subunit beta [Gammaproteobacteria bacterium]|nr:phenylalanine--tRNA ligase subunit beta [Gammaproteobacteria bacterium]|tara:strand:+ start:3765 stop:5780 length:2016 start_codon:yes stop_codon:yes gene_type:complete
MKVQYSYLKNFLNIDLTQEQLAEVFTKVGFECEIDGPIIDFDITPNRGDVLSLRGLQREFHAHLSQKLKDKLSYKKLKFEKDKTVINKIDKTGCGNYHLMKIIGLSSIKNLDSEKKDFLSAAGVPLISPLVDLGNYVMLEIGAPMHVFDLDLLDLPINVLFNFDNEPFQIIGGDLKNLEDSSLTIQDQKGVQAVAGIIGGEKTSVSKNTTSIAVEAAFFHPDKIVNQARQYGLATDASHRFERGVDPAIQKQALERFLFLLDDIAKYDAVKGVEGSSQALKAKFVPLSIERFNNFSGLMLTAKTISSLLENLGFALNSTNKKNLSFKVPSHRFDISLEEDLYEEILRCYGYDKIPINSPKRGPVPPKNKISLTSDLKTGLVYGGFKELMHMPFVSEENFMKLNSHSNKPAELLNPINENESLMRHSLFEGLFSAINLNVKKGYSSLKVFESGNVFHKRGDHFIQHHHISGIVYHHEPQKSWNSKAIPYDFYSFKAEIYKLLRTLDIDDLRLEANSDIKAFNLNSMDIFSGKKKIGAFGEIDLAVTQKLIKNTAFGFEFYPKEILHTSKVIELKPISKFPSSTRDINILISKSYTYDDIQVKLSRSKINYLHTFNLANTFEGKGIPDGFISLTMRFIFQSNDRSLIDSDVSQSIKRIIRIMGKSFQAKVRDQ